MLSGMPDDIEKGGISNNNLYILLSMIYFNNLNNLNCYEYESRVLQNITAHKMSKEKIFHVKYTSEILKSK